MNERVFEVAATIEAQPRLGSLGVRPIVIYAVEIEGDAPLYVSIEAVDE